MASASSPPVVRDKTIASAVLVEPLPTQSRRDIIALSVLFAFVTYGWIQQQQNAPAAVELDSTIPVISATADAAAALKLRDLALYIGTALAVFAAVLSQLVAYWSIPVRVALRYKQLPVKHALQRSLLI